ncbi:hypothetical protein ACJ72_07003 [Emergomyces africanus]|uniref:Uncharacterized protein n=1 Tax=Emergomyces africanus TaxID=1955775 RepID=A0A1B7NPI4_9EURO|nr:hypothetical protein ACJ72_07003 [Emergomyces africanus]
MAKKFPLDCSSYPFCASPGKAELASLSLPS